jgi:hypothetical protein
MKKLKLFRLDSLNVLKTTFLVVITTFSIQSCNKDQYEEIKGEELVPTSKALRTLFDNKEASLINVLTFNANSSLNYLSPKGVKLRITGSCLRKNGNPVTGEVKVKYIEIFTKGDMLAANKPTLGNLNGNKELLSSGGEFLIEAFQGDVKLTLSCPMSLEIPTSLTGGTQTGMQAFTGTIDANGDLGWEQATTFELVTNTQATTPVYAVLIPTFGWFNCDKFSGTPGPKTTIVANVPAGYGANAGVFLSVKAFPNQLGKSYGQFPVGLDCYLIFVTEKDGKFRYAIKPQVLTANHQVTFNLSETMLATADELTTAINALP